MINSSTRTANCYKMFDRPVSLSKNGKKVCKKVKTLREQFILTNHNVNEQDQYCTIHFIVSKYIDSDYVFAIRAFSIAYLHIESKSLTPNLFVTLFNNVPIRWISHSYINLTLFEGSYFYRTLNKYISDFEVYLSNIKIAFIINI